MMIRCRLINVYSACFLLIAVLFSYSSQGQVYNIVPLGNSITQANSSNYSYRYWLWEDLVLAGTIDFDFVGAVSYNNGGNPAWPPVMGQNFDQDHEGHWGWFADRVGRDLRTFMEGYTADVALIHIGTNDIILPFDPVSWVPETVSDIKKIITLLRHKNPTITILLAQLISVDPNATYTNASDVAGIAALNAAIPDIATDLSDPFSSIVIVDLGAGFDPEIHTYDGIHPNSTGEQIMADTWRTALLANLPTVRHIWVGNTSSDWSTASNWNLGTVPAGTDDVYIPATATFWPVVSGNLTLGTDCGNIVLDGNAELTVQGDLVVPSSYVVRSRKAAHFRIEGDLTVTGDFTPGGGIVEFTGNSNTDLSLNLSLQTGGAKPEWISTWGNYDVTARYNEIDCFSPFMLESVKVYVDPAGNAGTRTFYWATSDGTVQESVDINLNPAMGETRVMLNFYITPGTSHRIGILNTGDPALWRDNRDDIFGQPLDYPYLLSDVATIKSVDESWFDQYTYNYLYDFEYIKMLNEVVVSKNNAALITQGDVYIGKDLTLQPGAWMTNETGNDLVVCGDLLIEADASDIASFINHGSMTVRGNSTVEQYLSTNAWHYISAPISNAVSGLFTGHYLKDFDEGTNVFNYITSTTSPLNPMQGYAAWVTTNLTASYTGPLNDGSQSIAVDRTNEGHNLVGNPYPSALDWDDLGWTKNNVDNTIYFWEGIGGGGGGNYHYYVGNGGTPGVGIGNGTNIIPPAQGFFVLASAAGTLGVGNAQRVHNDQAFYKNNDDNEIPIIRLLAIDDQEHSDETVIRFLENATMEYDGAFDAYKLYGYEIPQLFSITPEGTELAISSIPGFTEELVIPLGFVAPAEGEYTLSLKEKQNFEASTDLILEDITLDLFYDLNEQPDYSFLSSPEDVKDRFRLHFVKSPSAAELTDEQTWSVHAYANQLTVQLPGLNERAECMLYNTVGQVVVSESLYSPVSRIALELNPGIYIVVIRTNSKVFTQKIRLN